MSRDKGGRPTVVTDECIQKLEGAFLMGCTDLEACLLANISKSSLYSYQAANPEFLDRKESLKTNPVMLARGVIIDALKDGDILTANKVIDRKEGSKVKIANEDGESFKVDTTWVITTPD